MSCIGSHEWRKLTVRQAAQLLRPGVPAVHARLAAELLWMAPELAGEYRDELLDSVLHGDISVGVLSLAALARLDDPVVTGAFLKIIADQSAVAYLRVGSLRALAARPLDSHTLEVVCDSMSKSDDSEFLFAALELLAASRNSATAVRISPFTNHHDRVVRYMATVALMQIERGFSNLPQAAAQLLVEGPAEFDDRAIMDIASSHDVQMASLPQIVLRLNSTSQETRFMAAGVILSNDPTHAEARNVFVQLSESGSDDIRRRVAKAMSRMTEPQRNGSWAGPAPAR